MTRWDYSCEEFRHRTVPFIEHFRLLLPRDTQVARGPAIRVTLSASNMRELFQVSVPIRITSVELDRRAMITRLLP
jgi:hypothetical protein